MRGKIKNVFLNPLGSSKKEGGDGDPSPRNRTLLRNRDSEGFIYYNLNPLTGSNK